MSHFVATSIVLTKTKSSSKAATITSYRGTITKFASREPSRRCARSSSRTCLAAASSRYHPRTTISGGGSCAGHGGTVTALPPSPTTNATGWPSSCRKNGTAGIRSRTAPSRSSMTSESTCIISRKYAAHTTCAASRSACRCTMLSISSTRMDRGSATKGICWLSGTLIDKNYAKPSVLKC